VLVGKYLDRTRKQGTIQVPTSTILEQDEPLVYVRLRAALGYMISKGGGLKGPRAMSMRVITKIMNEAMEDMRDAGLAPEIASMYMSQLGTMINWVADGTWNDSVPMPEDFTV